MNPQPQNGFPKFLTYGGWVVSIAVSAVLFVQFLSSPVNAVREDVAELKISQAVMETRYSEIERRLAEIQAQVNGVSKALRVPIITP
jgi:septation ring formation regulator EzrA